MRISLYIFMLLGALILLQAEEKKVTTKALYSFFNQKSGELVLKGNAMVAREDITLHADKILYMEQKKEAFATGNVKLKSDDFILEAGQLRVYLQGNKTLKSLHEDDVLVIAQKHPRLTEKADETGKLNQVTAVEIKFFKGDERIEAFENVKLVQMSTDGLQVHEEMVVTGKYMEYLHKRNKALVKGAVKLESKDLGGKGDRLIYYQKGAKFYLIGKASVYEYDKNGRATNEISGNRILHLIKEKRTILMGNVEGNLEYNE